MEEAKGITQVVQGQGQEDDEGLAMDEAKGMTQVVQGQGQEDDEDPKKWKHFKIDYDTLTMVPKTEREMRKKNNPASNKKKKKNKKNKKN